MPGRTCEACCPELEEDQGPGLASSRPETPEGPVDPFASLDLERLQVRAR